MSTILTDQSRSFYIWINCGVLSVDALSPVRSFRNVVYNNLQLHFLFYKALKEFFR
jgi:hypothetical protein